MKLGLVVSDFNKDITKVMEETAKKHAVSLGAEIQRIIHVPGVFDMPLAVKKLLENKEIDAVATLGAVIQGKTDHDILVTKNTAKKMSDLSLQFEKPVSLGIIGPRASRLEAEERKEEYAKRAVEAAISLVKTFL